MYLPTTYEGMVGAVGWYCGEFIVGNFDRGMAEYETKVAADPNYKANPFADKGTAKTKPADPFADYVARIRAGGGSREGMRGGC